MHAREGEGGEDEGAEKDECPGSRAHLPSALQKHIFVAVAVHVDEKAHRVGPLLGHGGRVLMGLFGRQSRTWMPLMRLKVGDPSALITCVCARVFLCVARAW